MTPGDWHRFESNLSLKQHRLFNEVFNKQVAQDSHHWRYKHEKTIDTVYFTPQRKKVRVSRDQEGHIVGLLEKHKVADMSIYCPASPFDIRLSINTETKLPLTTEEQLQSWTKQSERRKDRISYDFGHFIQVDLTQVRQQDVTTGSSITLHELELELIDVQRQMSHPDVGAHFISNVLDIARFASS